MSINLTISDIHALGKDQAFDILAQIARIEKKTFPANEAFPFGEDLWKKKPNTRVLYAVSTASGVPRRLVAYAVYVRQKGVALLHKVCVVEAFRRQGIGMQLMNYIRQRLQKEGCQYIQLWVDKAREPARSLYNRSGFEEREGTVEESKELETPDQHLFSTLRGCHQVGVKQAKGEFNVSCRYSCMGSRAGEVLRGINMAVHTDWTEDTETISPYPARVLDIRTGEQHQYGFFCRRDMAPETGSS